MAASSNGGSNSDSDSDIGAFADINFEGVDFDTDGVVNLPQDEQLLVDFESALLFQEDPFGMSLESAGQRLQEWSQALRDGEYVKILKDSADFFDGIVLQENELAATAIRRRVMLLGQESMEKCLELELLGIAALNLFMQLNYTGPSLEMMAQQHQSTVESDANPLNGIDPHPALVDKLHANLSKEEEEKKDEQLTVPKRIVSYHNSILSELTVDGEWPIQVVQVPYLLLIARSVLFALANTQRNDWTGFETHDTPSQFVQNVAHFKGVAMWSARAATSHQRLLPYAAVSLEEEVTNTFQACLDTFCTNAESEEDGVTRSQLRAAMVCLEWGLAQHHMDRPQKGKKAFNDAMMYSGVKVEVTGAEGKRTKYQHKATAQMLVRARSAAPADDGSNRNNENVLKAVEHSEDEILLEKIKFEEEEDVPQLTVLDQSILMALCLDVKNNNPADGLTGEQMGAYLARVLEHQDDWMVYSTALLERSWLEFESSHSRERSLLQMQALSDQHLNRLTLTQSTFDSVETSAPPQQRLRHLHKIVYPPRWSMIQDLAERYAKMGIVTSAAELFTEIEMWDQVVECYRRAGKENKAEQVVRERLASGEETPRMFAALGDITNDPSLYEKAVEVSKGRFADGYVALGKYYFDKGDIRTAGENYKRALAVRPLLPQVWFRLGTISMQLEDWTTALSAFSEVVQQEPTEADAWANVAAIHMRNKNAAEAYPALSESLRYRRNNWRVWISQLHTCLDLKKYDEAVLACNTLMDFKTNDVPELEEKCVRGIVGGSLQQYADSKNDPVALDSARRTLSRVNDLLNRLSSSTQTKPWVFETLAYFSERIGRDREVLENLMKEYRALQEVEGWEKDEKQVRKVAQVVTNIAGFHKDENTKESLVKCRFLVRGAINKIKAVYLDRSKIPPDVDRLELLMEEVNGLIKNL